MEINEKVYRPEGEEGRCPKCGHANALLHNGKESGYYEQIDSRIEMYECRDCGYKTIDPVFISYVEECTAPHWCDPSSQCWACDFNSVTKKEENNG